MTAPDAPLVVRDPLWVRLLMWVGFPIAGALLGWGVWSVSGWVATLEWAPWQGLFRLLSRAPAPAGLGVGALAGLVLAVLGWADSVTVTVGRGEVTLKRGDKTRRFGRERVRGVFVDGKRLVLLDPAGGELAREKSDLDASALREAFTARGYTWLDGDPHADRWRRWVEDDPALPGSAGAVLKARAKAVGKGERDDAAELRDELAKLGVVVRDDGKRQYWRLVEGG